MFEAQAALSFVTGKSKIDVKKSPIKTLRRIGSSASIALFLCLSACALQPIDEPRGTVEEQLIKKNIEWSERIDGWADGIDLFLMGRRITTRKNETSVRLENASYFREGDALRNSFNVHANLQLPNVEDYWQLKFTTYDDSEDRRGVRRRYLRQGPRDRNYGAVVGLFQSFGPIKTKFSPRIELQSPLRISHSLGFETVADMKTYQINPSLEFFANPDKGTGIFGALNVHFQLSPVWTFTLLNDGEYEENRNLFTVHNGFSFGQGLSETTSLSYNYIITSDNRPSYHLQSHYVGLAWNHIIYKRILDYEVVPYVEFPLYNDFKARSGLNISISLTF